MRQASDAIVRADLHVHTRFSPSNTFKALDARDSYSRPDAVYETAKKRGMDLVTFTDHDTIDGCLSFLQAHGEQHDFFISEEVETYLPELTRARIHINVFGLDERIHDEIQYLRSNMFDLVAYLKKEDLLFSLNHIFRTSAKDRGRMEGLIDRLLSEFDCFEVLNGSQLKAHNEFWQAAVERWRRQGVRKGFVGGSDAHTLRRVGTTFTAAPGASREDLLRAIREGNTFVAGAHGDFFATAFDALEVVLRYTKNVYFDNEERIPLPRRMRHMAVAGVMLPLSGIVSGVSTAVSFSKQTKMIRALRRGSRDTELPPFA